MDALKPKPRTYEARVAALASEAGSAAGAREQARQILSLAQLNAAGLIRLVHDPRYLKYRTGPFWGFVDRTCKTRWQLVHWVYADQPAKLSEAYKDRSWETLQIQSQTLYCVVSQLLAAVKPRYPWMWRRTLYGYAYGQSRPSDAAPNTRGKTARLYDKKLILASGGKRRVLYVPARPLARVQKAILRLILDPAQEALPDCVMGGRPTREGESRPYGIFRNAAAHVGQGFLASFDIANFFPSIRANDVINALAQLETPAIKADDGSPRPWSRDAAIFIGRLVTYRGRLPQGAPTSPAIANLVFRRYDKAILEQLGSDFVYTRYFDDLTVSISVRDAKKRGFETPSAFRDHVRNVITRVLERSSLRLNNRKTRCGDVRSGVFVTGLRVDSKRVSVSRRIRRQTRSLLHRIRSPQIGFAATASEHYRPADFLHTRFDSRLGRHRDERRRLSTEAMATMAMKQLCGSIRVEIPDAVEYQGGRRMPRAIQLHEGKQALRDASYLLTRLWRLNLKASSDDGHIIFHDAADRVVARLRCDRNDGFFLLEKRPAFACIDLWHTLTGMWSGLNPCSSERCFDAIKAFRDSIRQALDTIHISRAQEPPVKISLPENGEIISLDTGPRGEMKRHAGPAWKLLLGFRERLDPDGALPESVAAVAADFSRPVRNRGELAEWLGHSRHVIDTVCRRLPANNGRFQDVWDALAILDDRIRGRRPAYYDCEKKCIEGALHRSGHKAKYDGNIEDLADDVSQWVQAYLVGKMRDSLQESLDTVRNLGHERWNSQTRPNLRGQSHDERVPAAYRRLRNSVKSAHWKTTGKPVFSEKALACLAEDFHETFREPDPAHEWAGLMKFSAWLFGSVFEQLQGDAETLSPNIRAQIGGDGKGGANIAASEATEAGIANRDSCEEKRMQVEGWQLREELLLQVGEGAEVLKVLRSLRNRASHKDDTSTHGEWFNIVKCVASILGRHCRLKLQQVKQREAGTVVRFQDLSLSPLEVMELMLVLCDHTAAALESLAKPAEG